MRKLEELVGETPGLCERCRWARRIRTSRSVFWLCGLSRLDPRFERYPRTPVLRCEGYDALPPGETVAEGPPPREEE